MPKFTLISRNLTQSA